MTWVEIISALLGLSCVFLAGRGSKYNFWVGYVYNVFLFCLFWHQHLYAAMILQPVAFAINAFGHWRWTHPREEERSASDEKSLKVSSISRGRWAILIAMALCGGFVWAQCLQHFTEDPAPWLDSYILMFTFLAQYLSAQKKWECWMVWLLVNTANIMLYISSGLFIMPIVSILYITNGIWSLLSWHHKLEKGE